MQKLVDHVLRWAGRWFGLRFSPRHSKNFPQHVVQSQGKFLRETQAGTNDHSRKIIFFNAHRVIDGSERQVNDPIITSARYKPINKSDGHVVRVNDFRALLGGSQVFFV